jgi:hypothetical protein
VAQQDELIGAEEYSVLAKELACSYIFSKGSFLSKFGQDLLTSLKVSMAIFQVWLKMVTLCPLIPSIYKNKTMPVRMFPGLQNR